MQYTNLGRTALQVSRLCLGTMNFGPRTPEADSQRLMSRALELGINFFDTANVYGGSLGGGATEEIIGRWLAVDPARRREVVLATKVYGGMGAGVNERGLSARHIRQACEDSLRRLKTDHIDLYQMHHVDRSAPWEEIWQAMEQLVREGKVLYVGSSNFAAWNIAQANERASQRGFLGLVSEQSLYGLNDRMIELEVVPACEAYGLALLPWSPLGGGRLAGVLGAGYEGRRGRDDIRNEVDERRRELEAWEGLCSELGEEPAAVALAWVLHNPVVTAPIIGPRTMEQLEGSLRALDIKLSPEVMARLDAIFPGPGGQAPEAYAW